jgi:hypothetical protein
MPIFDCRLPIARSTRECCSGCCLRGTGDLRGQKIDAVENGDDLAAGQQFLQVIQFANTFVAEKTFPKTWPPRTKLRLAEEIDWLIHARARLAAYMPEVDLPEIGTRQSKIDNKWGGRRDSNPQQPEPQSGALPLSYGHQLSGLDFRFGRTDCKGKRLAILACSPLC